MCVEGNRNHGVRWMGVLALICPPVLLAENALSQFQTPQNWSSDDMNFKHGDHARGRIGISLKDTGGQKHEKRARFQYSANRRQSRDLVDSWGNPGWVILTSPPTDAPAWAYPGYIFVPTHPGRSPGVSTELQPVPIAQPGTTLSSLPAPAPQIWPPVKRTWQPSKIFPLPSPVLVQPTVEPAVQPFAQPVATLTLRPVVLPTFRPTPLPTARPIPPPTSWPTLRPTPWPTLRPTPWPTLQPTLWPTPRPTPWPTTLPAAQPVLQPTQQPVIQPVAELILNPTISPTVSATNFPSNTPFDFPSSAPTGTTHSPSQSPTAPPTQDRFGTDSRIITNENGDTGIVDFCRRSLPTDVLETVVDQAVVFDYELHLRSGSNPQLAIDFISTQVHRGLMADQMKCNWPGGGNSSNENVSAAPFYLSALSSLPVDFVRAQSADTACVDSDEYDCFIVDAAVTAKIFSLGSRRKLETQINITDMAIAETMDESLRSVFTNPGLLLEMSSIVGIMYKGLTNGPEGFTPRFSDPTTDESQARDSTRTGPLVGAIIGGILGFCLLRWLAGCLCTRCMGGGNGTQSDAKSDTNNRVVFSTEDEESDERNKSQDEREQSQNRSLLDDTDDDEFEMNTPIYSVDQPPHVWHEGQVDDDRYFYDSDIHRNPTTGIDVVDDLMRVEERRYRHPDTMDL